MATGPAEPWRPVSFAWDAENGGIMACKVLDKRGGLLEVIERVVNASFGVAPFWQPRGAVGSVQCALKR